MIRQPHHRRIGAWWARALAVSRDTGDIGFMLQTRAYAVNYYFWMGDLTAGRAVVEEVAQMAHAPQASSLVQFTRDAMETAIHIWALATPEEALKKINAALASADATGVHTWDHMLFALGAYGTLLIGDGAGGRDFLGRMEQTLVPSRRHGYCHFHYLKAWERLLADDYESAMHHAETALTLAEETGFMFPIILCRLAMTHVLLARGRAREAEAHAARAYEIALRTRSLAFRYMGLLANALVAFGRGREGEGLRLLRQGIGLGREQGYVSQLWWHHPTSLSLLCVRALEHGIEVEYVQGLIRKHGLVPERPEEAGGRWPWPLKIFTFGKFVVQRNDAPLAYSRKAPKKSLELLRLLVALGGKSVREDRLTELLWPDAEGDKAHKALNVAIVRLRELFGIKDALQVSEGAVSLDEHYVWTDARAFEKLVQEAEQALRSAPDQVEGRLHFGTRSAELKVRKSAIRNQQSEILQRLEKALQLYRGPFLGDEKQFWAIGPRERFRDAFLRAVEVLGARWERQRQWRKAVDVYDRGLAVDDLIEKFYVRMMACHLRLGSQAEALAVYRRLQKTLKAYGVTPSSESEELSRTVLSKKPAK
jgi:two-component SAPR family response regulator